MAKKGFAVFPILPDEKKPYKGSGGWKDATLDLAEVERVWTDKPDANIGIAPWEGAKPFVVFDFEGPGKGYDLDALVQAWQEKTGLNLSDTFQVSTPSGGLHAYYEVDRSAEVASVINFIPGVDIRAKGGYVLAPGSSVSGHEYRVCNRQRPALYAGPELRRTKAPRDIQQTLVDENLHDVRRAVGYLKAAPPAIQGEGGDDHTYRVACRVRDFGVSQETALDLFLEHWNERCEPPWHTYELATKLENAYRYSTLEAGSEATDPTEAFGDMVEAEPVERSRFYPWTLEELKDRPLPTWLVDKTIQDKGFGLLIGPYSQYKSFVAIDLACSVSQGATWAGRKIDRPRPVVFVAGEGAASMHYRFRAWHTRMNAQDNNLVRIVEAMPNFGDPEKVTELTDQLLALQPALVILDTVAVATQGLDENSSKDMGKLLAGVNYIQRKLGSFVLCIHHTGKDVGRGSRGWSGLPGTADLEIQVTGDPVRREAAVLASKVRDAERWEKAEIFSSRMIEVGHNKDGSPIEFPAFRHDPNAATQDKEDTLDLMRHNALVEVLLEAPGPVARGPLALEMAGRIYIDMDTLILDDSIREIERWLAKSPKAEEYQVDGTTYYTI